MSGIYEVTKFDWEVLRIYGDHLYISANDILIADNILNEEVARLISAAPQMFAFIGVLLHENLLQDSHQYRALSRAYRIFEIVTGRKYPEDIEAKED